MRCRRQIAALIAVSTLTLTGCESDSTPELPVKPLPVETTDTPTAITDPAPSKQQGALGDPADAARRYTEALLGGDAATACNLLSEHGLREVLATARFFGMIDGDTTCRDYVGAYSRLMDMANLDQLDIDATARRASVSTAVATVTVTMSKTKTSNEINLVAEGNGWKVDGFSGAKFSTR